MEKKPFTFLIGFGAKGVLLCHILSKLNDGVFVGKYAHFGK